MPRRPRVPSVLARAPFTVAQALDSGLSRRQLLRGRRRVPALEFDGGCHDDAR